MLRSYRFGDDNGKMECFTNNSGEFISFSLCGPTGSYRTTKMNSFLSYQEQKFIDSFRIQAKAINSLHEAKKANEMEFPSFVFKKLSSEQQSILLQEAFTLTVT